MLNLTVWRVGNSQEVELKVRVLGTYADTTPFDCPKSKLVFAKRARRWRRRG